tara:strand:- start:1097 stop:2191 length:1095 start_codon:yes stop_codon:yes gene_type:complete
MGAGSGAHTFTNTQFGIAIEDMATDNHALTANGNTVGNGGHVTAILQNWGVNYPNGRGESGNTGTAGTNLQVTKVILDTIAVDNLARIIKAKPGSGIFIGEDPDKPMGNFVYNEHDINQEGWQISLLGGVQWSGYTRSYLKFTANMGDMQAEGRPTAWDTAGSVNIQALCRQTNIASSYTSQKSWDRNTPLGLNPNGGHVIVGKSMPKDIRSPSHGAILQVNTGTGGLGAVSIDGRSDSIYAKGNVLANDVILTSDDRLKFDEIPIDNALDMIEKLSVKRYKKALDIMTPEEEAAREAAEDKGVYVDEVGVIAQEMNAIPEWAFCVRTQEDAPWFVNYGNINMVLLKAVQELSARVKQLESNNL